MIIDYTDEQKVLRKKMREYFAELIKPEYREALREAEVGDLYKRLIRQMGKDGWLAVRTTPDSRHKGVSMIVVDTSLDGFSYAPIHTVGGVRTNITYYDNIRVHQSMMIGEPNKSWGLRMSQLNHGREGLAAWKPCA